MRKRMFIMLLCLFIVFGCIFLFKAMIGLLIKKAIAENKNPIIPVSTMKVDYSEWPSQLSASGSLRAIKGVNVTTALAGMVQTIYFMPGSFVKEGTILVQLNAGTEIGQLQSLQAQAALAQITYLRDKKQYAISAVSKQQLDTDFENLQNFIGQVRGQAATVAKKTLRAPFTGRLGINNVNPGQYLNPGDSVTSLQTLDPIYVDFYVPQQSLSILKVGLPVTLTTDAFPNKSFFGKITTLNPAVETSTRNVLVEATLQNKQYDLAPGMFATVNVVTGNPKKYLTLPQTAVAFNPYGDIVYVVKNEGKDEKGSVLIASPVFVITGQARGDQIAIIKGITKGDMIVTSGQLKLKKGSRVSINDSIVPADNSHPIALNEHG
jgi:membrane fusion protein, multidrug efflux system